MRDWDRHFKPTLLAYVTTLEDPFGANCALDVGVREIWNMVWPVLQGVIDNPEKLAMIDGVVRAYSSNPLYVSAHALFSQASTLCSSWQSAIGKFAVSVVNSKMTSEELAAQYGSAQADRQRYITELTDDTTFHFLY